ncbi:uncharacterized protein LOC134240102 [Saccostrea cucullata]|uniref:uncharacterized protein LOC134240102 n=1 Tax=Saccostrea cuccullata TaxID=36930 RepID=UPI002ED560AF
MSTDYNRIEDVSSSNSDQKKTSADLMDDLKEEKDEKNPNRFTILLVFLSALVVLSLLVIIFLHVSKLKKAKSNNEEENGLAVNLQRSESTNESELEEIPQNEADYVEEEVVVVEYSNLMSQRVSLEQFIRELPEKKCSGILEREFDDLPNGLLESYSDALKASNRKGSRYKGIYPCK